MVDCPDLTQHGLPAPGLGGDTKLVEGGGEPFNHDTDYNRLGVKKILRYFVARHIKSFSEKRVSSSWL